MTFTVDVTNTGNVEGSDVVQLYISDTKCSVDRPVKELKAFQKVSLKPGETKTVTLTTDKRALSFWDEASDDWKAFGERLSGKAIKPFDIDDYQNEYQSASEAEKDNTALGRFIIAALAQKSMVTNQIYRSGSKLAGISIDYRKWGFRGDRAFKKLLTAKGENKA